MSTWGVLLLPVKEMRVSRRQGMPGIDRARFLLRLLLAGVTISLAAAFSPSFLHPTHLAGDDLFPQNTPNEAGSMGASGHLGLGGSASGSKLPFSRSEACPRGLACQTPSLVGKQRVVSQVKQSRRRCMLPGGIKSDQKYRGPRNMFNMVRWLRIQGWSGTVRRY